MVEHFLLPGTLFVTKNLEYNITTILGSCVSVCLFDNNNLILGVNHYLLPTWNGNDLPVLKYGDTAIQKLIQAMLDNGSVLENIKAKIFGGAAVIDVTSNFLNIGSKNIDIAFDLLKQYDIKIESFDVGGKVGRKIVVSSNNFEVKLKRIKKTNHTEYVRSFCENNAINNYK